MIDSLGAAHRILLQNHLPTAVYGEGTIEGQAVVLAKPLTYMNASGKAVADFVRMSRYPPMI